MTARRKLLTASEHIPMPSQFLNCVFEDMIWRVSIASRDEVACIDWQSVCLDDGSQLSAPNRRDLLYGCKLAVVLFAAGQKSRVRRPRGATILGFFRNLMTFASWLVDKRIGSFSGVGEELVEAYLANVEIRLRRVKRRREDGPAPRLGEDRVSASQRRHLADVIAVLVRCQNDMRGYGTSIPTARVEHILTRLRIPVAKAPGIRPIPEAVFFDLLERSISWLRHEYPKLRMVSEAYEQYRLHRRSGNEMRSRRRFDTILQERCSDQNTSMTIAGLRRPLRTLTHSEYQRLLSIGRAACFIVIAGLVGMRISEILSLRKGCLGITIGSRGERILRLSGTLYKTSKHEHGEPADWVAGYDDADNPVALAINALEVMPRVAGAEGLFAARYKGKSVLGRRKQRVHSSVILSDLRELKSEFGFEHVQFSPHQFRKTFATYVARNGSATLFPLMRHFKHVSVIMTERYIAVDEDLIAGIFDEARNELARKLDYVFGAERLGGTAGKRIVERNAQYRGSSNADARRKLVEMTLRDPGAHFRITPYGMCIYDESEARCGGRVEKVGIDACVSCKNFAVLPEHESFWRAQCEALEEHIEFRVRAGCDSEGMRTSLAQAKEIIDMIGGK